MRSVLVALVLAIALAGCSAPGSESSGGAATATAKLGLLSFSCRLQYGFNTCTGEVRNLTGGSLRNVTAVTSWRDADGAVQRTDEALVDFNPLLAGQTSTFKTIGSANPGLTKFDVRFKELLGGAIPAGDVR